MQSSLSDRLHGSVGVSAQPVEVIEISLNNSIPRDIAGQMDYLARIGFLCVKGVLHDTGSRYGVPRYFEAERKTGALYNLYHVIFVEPHK